MHREISLTTTPHVSVHNFWRDTVRSCFGWMVLSKKAQYGALARQHLSDCRRFDKLQKTVSRTCCQNPENLIID